MSLTIRICTGSDCSSQGSDSLIRDIEELARGQCKIDQWGCLGRCGKGPNIEMVDDEEGTQIFEGISTWKKLVAVLVDEAQIELDKEEKKVGKFRYKIRREEDLTARESLIQEAIVHLGGEENAAKSNPVQLAFLLLLRVKENTKRNAKQAMTDIKKAVQLAPKWAQAYLLLAQVAETAGLAADAAAALKTGIGIGGAFNASSLKRQLTRLERKAAEQKTQAPAQHEQPPAPIKKPAAAKKATAKKKPSVTSDSGEAAAPKASLKKKATCDMKTPAPAQIGTETPVPAHDVETPAPAQIGTETPVPAQVVPESIEVPDFLEWGLESVKALNHNIISMTFRTDQLSEVAKQITPMDTWHVDLLIENIDSEIKRAYTPFSDLEAFRSGHLEVMMKIYPKGRMTSKLASMRPGSTMLVSAPHRTVDPEYVPGIVVVGGSAVTIGIQVCKSIAERFPDKVLDLFLCNTTQKDVVYQEVFDEMLKKYPNFNLTHCISESPLPSERAGRPRWHKGKIAAHLLTAAPSDIRVLVSGPLGLCGAVRDMWQAMDRKADDIQFLDALPPIEAKPVPKNWANTVETLDIEDAPVQMTFGKLDKLSRDTVPGTVRRSPFACCRPVKHEEI